MSRLGERLLAVHASLEEAGFRHAFGGAIAYAYCAPLPRGTDDVDVNVFVGPDRSDEVLDALPSEVKVTQTERAQARRDGQVRVKWRDTPIDVFFHTHDFHAEVAKGVVEVPFEGAVIPILGCAALIVFKAMFNRTRDWADIEAMLQTDTDEGRLALEHLRGLMGPSDPVVIRLSGLLG